MATRPDGQPDLKFLSKELDAVHDFSETSKAKIYLRDTQTNTSDPVLAVEERIYGAQYSYNF